MPFSPQSHNHPTSPAAPWLCGRASRWQQAMHILGTDGQNDPELTRARLESPAHHIFGLKKASIDAGRFLLHSPACTKACEAANSSCLLLSQHQQHAGPALPPHCQQTADRTISFCIRAVVHEGLPTKPQKAKRASAPCAHLHRNISPRQGMK